MTELLLIIMELKIRIALPSEATILTRIAFAAKHSWDYPESYFEIWKKELTITKEYISQNIVVVAHLGRQIVGFYSIVTVLNDFTAGNVFVKKGFWLEHLFIKPEFQKVGIGKKLTEHALQYCTDNWIDELLIFVDPNAAKFYEKLGATFVENSPSSIEGREIPVYSFTF